MPYDPGISYRGDQYTFQGITGAAGALAGGLEDWAKKHQETMQKLQESGVLMDYAAKKGYVTPEQITKYAAANANQKADMGAALAKTIVLDQQDKENQLQRATQLQIANIAADARTAGGGTRGPATPQELAYAQSYAPPGYNAVPTATGWQLVGKDPGMAKEMPVHKPGELIPDPTDPKKPPIGMWQKNDEIKYFAEVDPQKKAIADAMQAYEDKQKELKPQGTGGGASLWHPSTWFGGGATPATPAVTPGPVIAPVAPQGATVVNPAAGTTPEMVALAQQALNDPNASEQHKAAARKILGIGP